MKLNIHNNYYIQDQISINACLFQMAGGGASDSWGMGLQVSFIVRM